MVKQLGLIWHAIKVSFSDRDRFIKKKKKVDLPNFHQVHSKLYRSGQPTKNGFKKIEELGIETVINLRAFHSNKRKYKKSKTTKLSPKRIPIRTWKIRDEHVVDFLKLLKENPEKAILVHCQHGADRTGLMVAMYRIFHEGWSKKQAIEELVNGGYGFHRQWKNIIEYIQDLDVEKIRKKAGI